MKERVSLIPTAGPRHAILDLAPLELECMNVLWLIGEGTVREIQTRLSASRPRAYTTIMTIMDRLAQKGIVARRKAGRAYRYQPNLTIDEARIKAVEKIVTGFFDGSAEALAAQVAALDRGKRVPALKARRENARRPEDAHEQAHSSAVVPVDGRQVSGTESGELKLDESLL